MGGMQGHHPRSSAAFLHGQALSCFSREECSVARVLKITRGRVKHRSFKDITADPFHGSCVHRHGALNGSFPCSRYMCAAVQRWRLVLTHVFLKTFFVNCALALAFFFASCSGCMFHRFFFLCSGCMFHIFFFMHGTPAAYAEQGERSAALPLEKGR